ncbi:hypothetical protein BJ085DRAFT_39256, partial [Dimargaris cristalligena]
TRSSADSVELPPVDKSDSLVQSAILAELDEGTKQLMNMGYSDYDYVYGVLKQCGGDTDLAMMRLLHTRSQSS